MNTKITKSSIRGRVFFHLNDQNRRNDERQGTLFRKQSFEYFNLDYFNSF